MADGSRRQALREYLSSAYGDDVVLLDGEEFDGGIIGVDPSGRVVYSYDKLAQALARHNKTELSEAMEWIDYNTIRSLPYMGPRAPLVINDLDMEDF